MNLLQQETNFILLSFHFLTTLNPYKFIKGSKHAFPLSLVESWKTDPPEQEWKDGEGI